MPALVEYPLVFAEIDKTALVSKDTVDNQKDDAHLKVETFIVETKTEVVRCGVHNTSVTEESKELVEETPNDKQETSKEQVTPREASVAEQSELPAISDAALDVGGTFSPTTIDNDDSDSDVSSMTTGTPPISCGEDEDLKPPSPSPVQDVMAMAIKFGERDVLDLAATLTAESWSLRPAVLPPMNLHMFWQNRAQYHRLGNYGAEESNMISCRYCGFQYNLQK